MNQFELDPWREIVRVRREGPREPLRTVKELAEIHGLPWQTLGKMLCEPGAPEVALNNRGRNVASRSKWYRPSEIARWLKNRGQT